VRLRPGRYRGRGPRRPLRRRGPVRGRRHREHEPRALRFAKSETPFGRDLRAYDSTIGARFPNPRIEKAFGNDSMPETADNIAAEMGLSREAVDQYAAQSQARYDAALKAGFYDGELQPIEVPQGRRKPPVSVEQDEHPRPQSTVDALSGLKPLFDGGVVTAGNASGINDGAAALIIGSPGSGRESGRPASRADRIGSHRRGSPKGYGLRARTLERKGACTGRPQHRRHGRD